MKLTSNRQAGALLRALRQAAGYSPAEFARQLHTSAATIHGREQGRQGIPLDALIATADQLGLEVALVPRGTTLDPMQVIAIGRVQDPGGLLRHMRNRAGLSLNDLAQRLGITKSGLGQRETDARAMTVAALTENLDALGYDVVATRRLA
jgi:transcriptional regulator with XRE-family HTH domain